MGGLTWATGSFDGTVALVLGPDDAFGVRLRDLFPLFYNATFLWIPFFGLWVSRCGFLGPSLAVVTSSQLMLACLAWPSEVTLYLAMLSGSMCNALLFSL